MKTKLVPGLLWAAYLLFAFLNTGKATNYTWAANATGNWSDPTKWFPNGQPSPTDSITIHSGTVTLDIAPTVSGLGMTGGGIVGANSLTITGNLSMNGGCFVDNVGDIWVGGAFKWLAGNFGSGATSSGTVTVVGLTSLLNVGKTIFKKTLLLNGGCQWASGDLGIYNNGTVRIPAGQTLSVNTTSGAYYAATGGSLLDVPGTFVKNGTASFTVAGPMNSASSMQINGNMTLAGGSNCTWSGTCALAAGVTLTQNGGTLNFNGLTLGSGGTFFQNSGTLNLNAGTTLPAGMFSNINGIVNDNIGLAFNNLTIYGTYNFFSNNIAIAGNLSLPFAIGASSSFIGNGAVTVGGNLTVEYGATLNNQGTTTVAGGFDFKAGSVGTNLSTSGTVTIAGLTTMSTTSTKVIAHQTLACNGGILWTSGDLAIANFGLLRCPAGQTFTANLPAGNHSISAGNAGAIDNFGTWEKTGPATLNCFATVNNTGTIRNTSATGGLTFAAGSTLNNTGPTGSISGENTISLVGSINNMGSISPGINGPGLLTLVRSNGLPVNTLNIEIASNAGSGTGHDQLAVIGGVTLTGATLNVSMPTCPPGGSYIFLTYTGTRTGTFSTLNLPVGCTIQYLDAVKSVQLTYADPAPAITCPTDITVLTDPEQCSADATFSATTTDNCGTPDVAFSPASGTAFPVGTTTVTATASDASGNTATCTFNITVNARPEICGNGADDDCDGFADEPLGVSLVSQTNPTCGQSNGSLHIGTTCGLAPYSFAWSNGNTTQNPGNLAAGAYTVTVTDAQGLTQTLSATLTQASGGFLLSFSAVKPSCPGMANGSATALPSGGSAPYTYLWSGGQTAKKISNIAAGSYTVTVSDKVGCSNSVIAIVTDPLPVSMAFVVKNVLCSGGASGKITVSASGGTGGKTYLWNTGGTSRSLVDIPAGNYTVTVTDSKGCTASASVGVTEPPVLGLTPEIGALPNGKYKITLSGTGGTPPFKYCKVSNGNCGFGAANVFTNLLAATTYTLRVRDANACTAEIMVTTPSSLDFADDRATPTNIGLLAAPNPFSGAMTIRYDLAENMTVSLKIVDLLGKTVAVLAENESQAAGPHEAVFRETELPAGVYCCELRAGNRRSVMRVVKQ